MSNNVMAITVERRFDYDNVKLKHFVRLLNENITNAASTGPMIVVPFLVKLTGDIFIGKLLQRNADLPFDFFSQRDRRTQTNS